MSKPEDNGGGQAVGSTPRPHLIVGFDQRTYSVNLRGSVPNWPFARYLLLEALTAVEEKIQADKTTQRIALAGPELLENLRG
jgi:hypothetical protein